MDGTAGDETVFGYQRALRGIPLQALNDYRSNALLFRANPRHLAPVAELRDTALLNDAFIQETPPVGRVIAVPTSPEFHLRFLLPTPLRSSDAHVWHPGNMDRF